MSDTPRVDAELEKSHLQLDRAFASIAMLAFQLELELAAHKRIAELETARVTVEMFGNIKAGIEMLEDIRKKDNDRHAKLIETMAEKDKRIAELEQVSAAGVKDAERYRWIREPLNNGYHLNGPEGIGKFEVSQKTRDGQENYHRCEYLDAAIDAAMSKGVQS